jgi:hypothetical protein
MISEPLCLLIFMRRVKYVGFDSVNTYIVSKENYFYLLEYCG